MCIRDRYIKALKALSSDMKPHTVKRTGASHDSDEYVGNIASASKSRELIRSNANTGLFLPSDSQAVLTNEIAIGAAPSDMNLSLIHILILRLLNLSVCILFG